MPAPFAPIEQPSFVRSLVEGQVQKTGLLGASLGFELIDNDWFFTTQIAFDLKLGPVALGLGLPLRFRIADQPPIQNDEGSVLRSQDWDDWTDFARLIRYVQLGTRHQPYAFRIAGQPMSVYVRLGDLQGATIGHGTLMHQYMNNLDPNKYNLGLALNFHTSYGGVEWVMNNVLQPTLVGGRVYVRPGRFFAPRSFFSHFAVGMTVLGDAQAPFAFQPSLRDIGSFADPEAYFNSFQGVVAVGFDVSLDLIRSKTLDLVPYMDLNVVAGQGTGYHAGILAAVSLPLAIKLQGRLEYRVLGAGYMPQCFDSLYELQRYSMPVFGQGTTTGWSQLPKQAASTALQSTRQGLYGELTFRLKDWVVVGAAFDEYEVENNGNLALTVQVPAFKYFQLSATYIKRGFDGIEELFQLDDRSFLVAELQVPIWKYFVVSAQYRVNWTPTVQGDELIFSPVSQFAIQAGARFQF